MSKNIVIQEHGIAKSLTVDALRLKKQTGGSEDWVPSDGKDLVELQIGGSGTYKASDYNAYGIAVARVKPKYGGGATSKAYDYDFTEKRTPSIKEGSKSRVMMAAMLKTNLQGGGTCLWIPRMDVTLKNKYITHSGTYTAEADDCYGFDQVTVSGVDVTIDKDDDGDDVAAITDGGQTTEEKLPDYISVTVLPQKLDYNAGESIDYTGLVVHAYTKSGIDLGIVPFDELILPATTAGSGGGGASSDLDTSPISQPIPCSSGGFTVSQQDSFWITNSTFMTGSGSVKCVATDYGYDALSVIIASGDTTNLGVLRTIAQRIDHTYPDQETNEFFNANASYTHDGKTVYYFANSVKLIASKDSLTGISLPVINMPVNYGRYAELAWTMVYGVITGAESIPVQWHRPYDDRLLETSFNIHVN